FSSRRRHTRFSRDWSSDVCSSDLYLSGDGHFRPERGRWMASSVSRPLLLGMAMLAQRAHGAVATLIAGRAAGTKVIDGRQVHTRSEERRVGKGRSAWGGARAGIAS